MKINENIVLSMVAPHVVDNALTYEKFDELFAMLSRSEQYSVTDLLAAHHIELRDADDDLAQAYATEFTADSADQPLFDHSVFGGNDPTACSWLQMRRGFLSNEQLAKAAHAGNRDAWNTFAVRVVFTDGFPFRHMVKYDSKEKEYDQYVSETLKKYFVKNTACPACR